MYKRTYNSLLLEIKKLKSEKKDYEKVLFNLDNMKDNNYHYYQNRVKELIENPSKALICLLIDKIEIDEEKNIDIYDKFKQI